MHKGVIAVVGIVGIVAIVVIVALVAGAPPWQWFRGPQQPSAPSQTTTPLVPGLGTAKPPQPVPFKPVPMQFSKEGLAGQVADAVGHVVRPERVQVAVWRREGQRPDGHPCWLCVVVDGEARCYELDQGLTLNDFPCLRDAGFQPVTPEMSRQLITICRSVARTHMNYDADRGDHLIVLLCPKGDWPKLSLQWPGYGLR